MCITTLFSKYMNRNMREKENTKKPVSPIVLNQ